MADIFSDVLNLAGGILNQMTTGDNLADRKHASKLFVADNYRLVPKFGFLYHVYFDLNNSVVRDDPNNPLPNRNAEIGMMAKSVGLPTFSIDVKKMNAYNRPNYVRGKVTYNPINITFHDDSSDLIRNFWFDYYNYYYRDSDYPEEMYAMKHKYNWNRPTSKWGYSPRDSSAPRYINSIRIYSMTKKHFSEYVLINPVIKSFNHGEHQAGSSDLMTHTMTVEYETVLYYYGKVGPNVKGFADLHYDKAPSPISVAGGGTRSVLGEGGILEQGDDILHDLATGNFGSAAFKAGRLLQNVKHMDLGSAAIGDIMQAGKGILRGNDPSSSIFIPSIPGISNDIGAIGSKLGGVFDGAGGGGGNNWLIGAAGLGLAALTSSKTQSQEVTSATNFVSGTPPATPTQALPAPSGATVVTPGVSTSTVIGGDTTINNTPPPQANAQGTMDATAQKATLNNNISVRDQQIKQNQATITGLGKQSAAIDATIASLSQQKSDLLAAGVDPKDPRVTNLDGQVSQQQGVKDSITARLTDLNNSTTLLTQQNATDNSTLTGLA